MRTGGSHAHEQNLAGPASRTFDLVSIWRALENPPPSPWYLRFFERMQESFKNISQSPLTFFVASTVVAAVTCFLSLLVVIFENVGSTVVAGTGEIQMSLFLAPEASLSVVNPLIEELKREPGVLSVTFMSKEAALAYFRDSLGELEQVADGLSQDNPLPASIELSLAPDLVQVEQLQSLARRYEALPEIDSVHYDRAWYRAFSNGLLFLGRIGLVLVLSSLLLAAFIVSNTVKLALFAHREELEIVRLMGARFNWIAIPYLFEGAWIGLLGVGTGLGVAWLLFYSVQSILDLYAGTELLQPHFLTGSSLVMVVSIGIIIGTTGTYSALRSIVSEPKSSKTKRWFLREEKQSPKKDAERRSHTLRRKGNR